MADPFLPSIVASSNGGAIATLESGTASVEASPGLQHNTRGSFGAAFTTLLPVLPLIATAATLGIFLVPVAGWLLDSQALLAVPWIISLVVGVCLALLQLPSTSAECANNSAFVEITERLSDLSTQLASLVALGSTSTRHSRVAESIAHRRVAGYIDIAARELSRPGAQWVLGTGYTSLGRLLNRADEILLPFLPSQSLLEAMMWDERRLQRLPVEDRAELLTRLREAALLLRPTAPVLLVQTSPLDSNTAADEASKEFASTVWPTRDQDSAVLAAAQVRRVINDYLEHQPDPLARIRALSGTLAATGVCMFILAAIALMGRPPEFAVVTAATLFVVGAMVGLFNQLYMDSNNRAVREEQGLTAARLSLTPVLSGLAAVAGVVLIALLPLAVPSTAQSTASAAPVTGIRVDYIFNLEANPLSLLLAALFGLAPGRFFGMLQKADSAVFDARGG